MKSSVFIFMTTALLALLPLQAQLTYDNGTTNVVDTTINNFISVENSSGGDPTTATFNTGAEVTGDFMDLTVAVGDTSIVIINDGVFAQDVASFDSATLSIFGGSLNDDLVGLGNSVINFYDGTLADDIEALGSSTINLLGGSYGQDIETAGGTIDISGGTLAANGTGGGLFTDENGTIILQGFSFSVNGSAFTTSGTVSDLSGTLSGTLADGTTFSNIAFDRDPSGDGSEFGTLQIMIIPELGSLTLMGVAGLVFLIGFMRVSSNLRRAP